LIKCHGSVWLTELEAVLEKRKPTRSEWEGALAEVRETWQETAYAKGHLGGLRDFALLSYPEAPLTGKVLRDIHRACTRSLQRILRNNLECDFERQDATNMEETMFVAMKQMIQLHVQAARNVRTAIGKEGRLPAKWRRDEEVAHARIAAAKARGTVDAKWTEPVKWAPHAAAKSSLTAANKAATRRALTMLLVQGPPARPHQKRQQVQQQQEQQQEDAERRNAKIKIAALFSLRFAPAPPPLRATENPPKGKEGEDSEEKGAEFSCKGSGKEGVGEALIESAVPTMDERRATLSRLLKH